MSQGSRRSKSKRGSSMTGSPALFLLPFTSPSSQMARPCVCRVSSFFSVLFSFNPPSLLAPASTRARTSTVVQQCHLAGRTSARPLCCKILHLFYNRSWGKHNSVGTVMGLSSPHQELGNRETIESESLFDIDGAADESRWLGKHSQSAARFGNAG